MGNDITAINSPHAGDTNKDDVVNIAGGTKNNANGGGSEKEKQSTVDQHTQVLAAANQTIAMMHAQMERLECIIMT